MQDSKALKQARRKNRKDREARREQLLKLGKDRLKQNPAPSFRFDESELLKMKTQLDEVVRSNNMLVEELTEMKKRAIMDRAEEAHYMMQVVLTILTKNGMVTEAELQDMAREVQAKAIGLEAKQGPSEMGDVMIIGFKLMDGTTIVEDRTKEQLAYTLGSKGFKCEDGMVGMQPGETRMFEETFDSPSFKKKEYLGKPLQLQVTCHSVQRPDPARLQKKVEAPQTTGIHADETLNNPVNEVAPAQ